jgi:hypothetical protein
MEMQRVHVSTGNIIEYVPALKHVADNIPTPFFWNTDEIGHSDWADAHPVGVYVPTEFDAGFVPIPVNRGGKPVTLVGCRWADGTFVETMAAIRWSISAPISLLWQFLSPIAKPVTSQMVSTTANLLRNGSSPFLYQT